MSELNPSAVALRRATPTRPLSGVRMTTWTVAALLVALAAVFVAVTGVRPAYDAYGWLTWGHQAWQLALNTDAAPSWKPLTFLFTLPFALAGRDGATTLWMVTAAAGAFALPVLAGDLARRLVGHGALAAGAGVLAGVGVLDIGGFWHGALTATADAPIAALCLGAASAHLAGRRRTAFGLLCLAALGRPEATPYAALLAVALCRAGHARRLPVLAAVLALWVAIPAVTSHTALSAGTTALAASTPVQGSPVLAVVRNFVALNALPVHLAALAGMLLAFRRRDRTLLVLAGAASLWVAMWCALATAGWEPDGRYMLAPASAEVVLAAIAIAALARVGRAGQHRPRPRRDLASRALAVAAASALILGLVPVTATSGRLLRNGVMLGQNWADQLGRLKTAVDSHGGPARILACGAPVTTVSYQSILAYDLGTNVASVGWQPGPAIADGRPIVLFLPYVAGWHIRPMHTTASARASCRGLRLTTPYAYSASFRDFLEDGHLLAPGGRACSLPGTPPCPRSRARAA